MQEEHLNELYRSFQKNGDVEALAEVFDLAAPKIERVARHLCGDEAEAEDALQATFQTAIEKVAEWDAARPLMPWLLGILSHHARRARERAERAIEEDRLPQGIVADPAALAADHELGALVAERLEALPETYASAVRFYLMDGKPAREIALSLGISANAASVRVHRGLKLLQRTLPAGISLGAAGVLFPTRGLAAIKGEVLASAGTASTAGTAGSAAAATAANTLSSTVLLTSKPVLAVGATILLAGALYLSPLDLPGSSADERAWETAAVEPASPAAMVEPASVPENPPAVEASAGPETSPVAEREQLEANAALTQTIDPEAWLQRFREAEGWRAGLALGYEIAALQADEALALLQAIYHQIPAVEHRQQLLKAFVFHGGHVHAVEILHLAATDASLAVQGWAFDYLKNYAFQDFSEDFARYQEWRSRTAGLPLGEVLEASARELVVRLGELQGQELARELQRMNRLDLRAGAVGKVDLAAVLRDGGLLDLAHGWLVGDDPAAKQTALGWLKEVRPPDSWLRSAVLPLLLSGPGEDFGTFGAVCRALGNAGSEWAVDPLMDAFRQAPAEQRKRFYAPIEALAEIGDARVIPTLIGMIAADPSTKYSVGYYGLGKLTGVDYDDSHDGAFWIDWWEKNQNRLPKEIRGLPIPTIQFGR